MEDTYSLLTGYVPRLVGAIIVLVLGWIVAAVAARGTGAALKRANLGTRIAQWFATGETVDGATIETWSARAVFALVILLTLVGFFQVLGLTQITEPLTAFLNELAVYAPRLIGPAILFVVAWGIAKLLKILVSRSLAAIKLDERLGAGAELPEGRQVALSKTLADAAYWLTFLLFLPAILNALDLGGLLEPVQGMVDKILAYLPNLLAATLILLVGWFAARVMRQILTHVLQAVGVDRLSENVGLKAVLGQQSLSGLIALISYILILVPVVVAALNALELSAVTGPASDMLGTFLSALPHLFAAALVLVIAYVVARVLASLVTKLLQGVGFDSVLSRLGLVAATGAEQRAPSQLVGYLVQVAVILFATIEALRLMGFDAVAELGKEFLVFAGEIVVGLAVMALGLFLANLAATSIQASKLEFAGFLAIVARMAILVLAAAIGLGQMGFADDIIALAFGILFGALALAIALAFGLGCRDVAGRLVNEWSKSLTERAPKMPRQRTTKSETD